MDRLQGIEVFVRVAELGGFAKAARDLGLSPPAATRAVSALEDRLGARLLVRTTRSVRLTESGARFLADAKRLLAELQEAEESAAGDHAEPRGELRITAPLLFGRLHVAPVLAAFLDRYPLVSAQALFLDRSVSLMEEGLDLAVRIGPLPDSSLIAIKVGEVRPTVFASPAYLARAGTPQRPSDLSGHRLIHANSVSALPEWRFLEAGSERRFRFEPRLTLNANEAVRELAESGWGVARLLSYQVAEALSAGRLVRLLEDYEPAPLPVHLLHPEGRRTSAKLRAFVDFAALRLGERLRALP